MVKADMPLTKSMIQDAYLGARWSLNKNVDVENQIDYSLRQLVDKILAQFDNKQGWTATGLAKQEITPSDPYYSGLVFTRGLGNQSLTRTQPRHEGCWTNKPSLLTIMCYANPRESSSC